MDLNTTQATIMPVDNVTMYLSSEVQWNYLFFCHPHSRQMAWEDHELRLWRQRPLDWWFPQWMWLEADWMAETLQSLQFAPPLERKVVDLKTLVTMVGLRSMGERLVELPQARDLQVHPGPAD